MGISEDLQKLRELHQSGALTDEEFAAAKAKALETVNSVMADAPSMSMPGPDTRTPPPANARNTFSLIRVAVLFVILLGVSLLALLGFSTHSRQRFGSEFTDPATQGGFPDFHLRQPDPVDLIDQIQNLPANTIKWVTIKLPYNGNLHIDIQTIHGNPIDVFLVDPSEIDAIKAHKQFNQYTVFEAEKTSSYRRSGNLAAGTYYLVFIDRTLGILSASSTDIQMKVRLEP